MTVGSAMLVLVGDVSGASARDARAKAELLLGYDHIERLDIDLRGAGAIDSALLEEIEEIARDRGKSVIVREV